MLPPNLRKLMHKTRSTSCSLAFPFSTFWNILEYTNTKTPPGPMPAWKGRAFKFFRPFSQCWKTDPFSVPSPTRRATPLVHNSNICFYDRNPASKGLDFDGNPDQREPSMRYAVSFQLQNRMKDFSSLSISYFFVRHLLRHRPRDATILPPSYPRSQGN